MNWAAVTEEAVGYLCDYLRIDTSNPPGNESEGVEWLGRVLTQEGIPFDTFESEPGRANLVARLRGSGPGKPLILLNHVDVVQAQASEWQVHPFSGAMRDGYVWGRGAVDMKSVGIMELMAMLLAQRQKLDLQRDVVFLAVADEEAGGSLGAKYMMEHHPEQLVADLVINEGGFGNTDLIPEGPLLLLATDDKSVLWLRLVVRGPGGHGSVPARDDASVTLVHALARLLDVERPLELRAASRAFFATLAGFWEFLKPYEETGTDETLLQLVRDNNLAAVPFLHAMLANTIALTELHAGQQPNVRPDRAEAVLDCRLLPGTDPDAFIEQLRQQASEPALEIEVILREKHGESPLDVPVFEVVRQVLSRNFPGAAIAPVILPGISDSRFFRAEGIPTVGIPHALFKLDDMKLVHGIDEKLSVENLLKGIQVLYDLVVSFCAAS